VVLLKEKVSFAFLDTSTSLTYFLAISLKELEGKKIIVFIFVDD
jgi:hypothetical protein